MTRTLTIAALVTALCVPFAEARSQEEEHPLIAAAGDGNLAAVRALLDQGGDPNEVDESKTTALMAASWGGHLEVVQLLLDRGARLDDGDASGATALMAASIGGHTAVVELLLERGADIALRDAEGDDALNFGVFGDAVDVVTVLLVKGADPNGRNAAGQTPLLLAAQRDSADLLLALVERGADLTAQDDDGDAALNYAARGGSAEVATLLIERGSDPNRANTNGVTPLLQAAASANAEVLDVLLERGADVAAVDSDSNTALHHAARTGSADVITLLLDRGSDVDASAKGWTAWMIAVARFDTATAAALAARGARHDDAHRTAVERTTEAGGWAQGMRIAAALSSLAEARALVPDVRVPGEVLNIICWNGTLGGMAHDVAGMCDEAVEKLPTAYVRDSRGLNRAVRGDLSGARADFESFVLEASGDAKAIRQRWIAGLDGGTNPITPRVLESLRYPWLAGSAIAASRQLGFDLIAMVPGLADVPDSALISQEAPYETSGFQRVYTAGGSSFGWGGARLAGVVFNATLMGAPELAESGIADIDALDVQTFRDGFLPAMSSSMGFDADAAEVERTSLDSVTTPRTAWRISAETLQGPAQRVDIHLVFIARARIVGTCLIVGLDRVPPADVVRIVRLFEAKVLAALPEA